MLKFIGKHLEHADPFKEECVATAKLSLAVSKMDDAITTCVQGRAKEDDLLAADPGWTLLKKLVGDKR